MHRQRGAFLAIMAVLIIALLGFASLAIDVGRVLVLRAEMQNAADFAALAAAAQLNSKEDAIERAKIAARNALDHNNHFARVRQMLTSDTLPDEAFVFFCVIGAQHDIDAADAEVDFNHFCSNGTPYSDSGVDARKYEATGDSDAHYVRVRLASSDTAVDNFTLDLIFYPLIHLLGGEEVISALTLEALALAGRNFFSCNIPPLAICDPFEASGQTFEEVMQPGGHINLVEQGSANWTPGNSGFLKIVGPGAPSLAEQLADEDLVGCQPPLVELTPINARQQIKWGINTRFGIYEKNDADYGTGSVYAGDYVSGNSSFDDPEAYPPAPHIGRFPPIDNPPALDSQGRFGKGDWECGDYWDESHGSDFHAGHKNLACTPGVKRWEVYNYEIANGLIDDDMEDEHAAGDLNRRKLHVAVLSCGALGLGGGSSSDPVPVFHPDGFAKIFLTTPVLNPSASKIEILAEYIGWGDEDDATFHVNVQLYE